MTRRMLTFADRADIAAGLKANLTLTEIGAMIGRDKSVVSREVTRNSTKTSGYRSITADDQAATRRRRPQARKIAADGVLEQRVLGDLKAGRSPGAIAGRLQAEAAAEPTLHTASGSIPVQGRTVSHEAIYSYMYALPKGQLAAHGVRLDSGRTRRVPRKPVGRTKSPIIGMVSIEDRPADEADRKIPGSWEGDLVMGAGNATAVATLVERATRFTIIIALPMGKNADGVAEAIIDRTTVIPDIFRRSLTWDQGTEMARHQQITAATAMPVYFAHPHSPWERGSNENRNRVIRRYLPKGTPITTHQPYLDAISDEINEIPMKLLGWKTPREAYEELLVASTS